MKCISDDINIVTLKRVNEVAKDMRRKNISTMLMLRLRTGELSALSDRVQSELSHTLRMNKFNVWK